MKDELASLDIGNQIRALRNRRGLTLQDLADLTGTTLSTSSRTLSSWDRQGLIRAGREHVIILQAHRLVAIAEDLTESPQENA